MKKIYQDGKLRMVSNISAYLTAGENIIVRESRTPIVSSLPKMYFGNIPNDGNGLVVELDVYQELLEKQDESLKYLKKYVGASEFIRGTWRYCIWLTEENHIEAEKIPFIKERVEITRLHRLSSTDSGTNRLATESWRFRDTNMAQNHSIIIPNVSSENRLYVPMGILEKDIIITNASVIYDAPIWLLGLLQSRMHMTWLRAIGGRLKTDYRYSAGMVYNTFPVPKLSNRLKNEIEEVVTDILDIRDEEGGTLAELYGSPLAERSPKPMNKRLQLAHEHLDRVVEKAYRSKLFENDEDRLELLLSMYQEKVNE